MQVQFIVGNEKGHIGILRCRRAGRKILSHSHKIILSLVNAVVVFDRLSGVEKKVSGYMAFNILQVVSLKLDMNSYPLFSVNGDIMLIPDILY